MTARWTAEMTSPPLKVEASISGYPLHDREGWLKIVLGWRFGQGDSMYQEMSLAEDAVEGLYRPLRGSGIRLTTFELTGGKHQVMVDMYLSPEREFRFVLRHPSQQFPIELERQPC